MIKGKYIKAIYDNTSILKFILFSLYYLRKELEENVRKTMEESERKYEQER